MERGRGQEQEYQGTINKMNQQLKDCWVVVEHNFNPSNPEGEAC